ncbi:MAG: Gfo/Idh/MocA family oxidoreductase [Bacteroidota bacterium]
MKEQSRRAFLRRIAGTSLLTTVAPTAVLSQTTRQELILPKTTFQPNDKIRFATIGMGIMGFNNTNTAIQVPGTELVAVCDLYDGRLIRAKEVYGNQIQTTRNFQEIIDRKDIDAVIVATTDHWHDHISIAALKAGKAVYCEKPMVHHLDEGHAVIQAAADSGQVLQVGSQRVSSILYEKAREIYRSGVLGKLIVAEVYNDRFSHLGAWQYSIPTDASLKTIDWKAFLGDAPKVDYDPMHFFRWRNYQAYGTGVAGDLFVHLFSGLHFILDSNGPEKIYATGGLRHWQDGRDVPDVILGSYDYPETDTHAAFNVQMRVNFVDGSGGGSGLRLIGSEGEMQIRWGSLKVRRNKLPQAPGFGGWDSFKTFSETEQKAFKEWYAEKYPVPRPQVSEPEEMEYLNPKGYSSDLDHHANFFHAVREKKSVVEDAAFGLRAAGPALATNLSYFGQKIIHWDPVAMKVKD